MMNFAPQIFASRWRRAVCACLVALVLSPLSAFATDYTWILNNNGTWNTNANWTSTPAATFPNNAADTATFGGGLVTGSRTVTGAGTFIVAGITFNDDASYTIQPTQITLSGAPNSFIKVDALNTGTHLISANTLLLTTNVTVTVDDTVRALTISSTINGSGRTLTKDGNGRLILSGSSGYSGDTTVTAGTLELSGGGDSSSGTGNILVGTGATLRVSTLNSINNTSSIDVGSGGTFELGANETIGGLTGGGTVNRGASASGTATLAISNASSTFSGVLQDSGGGTLAFSKLGTGTVTFNGGAANTYAGLTTITGGSLILSKTSGNAISGDISLGLVGGAQEVLQLGAANQISDTSLITFAGAGATGGLFRLNGNSETVGAISGSGVIENGVAGTVTLTVNEAGSHTYSGVLQNGAAGTLALTKTGNGTLTLSGSNTYSGLTTVSNGVLELQGPNGTGNINVSSVGTLRLGASDVIDNGSTVDVSGGGFFELTAGGDTIGGLTGTGTVNRGLALSGTAILTIDNTSTPSTTFNGVLQNSGSGTLALTKTGTASFTLAGTTANTYTGNTAISGGTLFLGKTAGVNAIAGNITVGNSSGIDTLELTASNQIANTSVLTLAGSSTSSTSNVGIFRLAGNNETVGGLASAGTGSLRGIIENGVSGTSTLTVDVAAGTSTFAGQLRDGTGGTLALTKTNAGTLSLAPTSSFPSTFTGAVTVSGGRLIAGGTAPLGAAGAGTFVSSGAVLELQTDISSGEVIQLNGQTTGGILDVTATSNIDTTSKILLGATSNINVASGQSLIIGGTSAGTLDGGSNFDLRKEGAGSLRMGSSATVTNLGNLYVDAGRVEVTAAGGLGAGGNTIIENGAALYIGTGAGAAITVSENIEIKGTGISGTIGALASDGPTNQTNILSGTITLSGTNSAIGSAANNKHFSITGKVTGLGGLLKVGISNLTLNNTNNDYAGATTITGSSSVILLGAANVLPDTTDVTVNTNATLNLNGFNDSVRTLTLVGGNIGDDAIGASDTLTLLHTGDALTLNGAGGVGATTSTIKLGGAGGRVVVAGSSASSTLSVLDMNGVAHEFSVGDVDSTPATDLSIGGAGIRNGSFTKTGAGTMELTAVVGASPFTSADVQAGTLFLSTGSTNRIPDTALLQVSGTGTFELRGSETVGSVNLVSGTITDNGVGTETLTSNNITVQSGTLSLRVAGTGGLTKTSAGTVFLGGSDSTYTGVTQINGGVLAVGNLNNGGATSSIGQSSSASDRLTFSGGTLQILGTSHTTDRGFTLSAGGGSIDVAQVGTDMTFSGVVAGSSGNALTKLGPGHLILSNAANTYSGNTNVSQNRLSLIAANNNNIPNSNTINIGPGGLLNVQGLNGGRLVLNSGQTLTGGDDNGIYTLHGSVTIGSGSFFSPGANTGFFITSTDATYASGGTYIWQINSVSGAQGANPGWDHHAVGGTLDISAASGSEFTIKITGLNLSNVAGAVNGFNKYDNYSWDIATASSISNFAATDFILDTSAFISNNAINGGATNGVFSVAVVSNNLRLSYLAATEPPPSVAYWKGDVSGVWNAYSAGNSNWDTTATGGIDTASVPGGGVTDVFFSATGAANLATSLSGDLSIKSLTFTSTAGAVSIAAGNTLTIGTGGITVQAGSAAHVINVNTALSGGPQTWLNSSANLLTVGGNVSNGANTLTIDGSGNTTINGIIGGGAGGLTKNGAGTLTLGGANTYGGSTVVNAGTLTLGASNVLPGAAVSITGPGSLNRNGNSDTIGSLSLTGANVSGAGTLTLGGTLTSSGTSSSSGGTLGLGGVTRNVDVTAGTLTLSDVVTSGNLVKLGAGSLILSNTGNNYGNTQIDNGTLRLGAANVLPDAGDVTVNAGVLDQNGNSDTIDDLSGTGSITLGAGTLTVGSGGNNNSGSFGGSITGSGGLAKSGAGIQEITSSMAYTGGTTVNNGILRLSTAGALVNSGDVSVGASGTLHLNGVSDTIDGLNGSGIVQLSGGVTLTVGSNNDATADFAGSITGSGVFIKLGSGTQTFSGSGTNSYNGLTTVQAGTLILNRSSANGAVPNNLTISGGTVQLNASNQISNASVVSLTSGALSLNGQTDQIGDFTNSGGTFTTGAGSLTAANVQWQSGSTNTVNTGGSFTATSLTVSGGTNSVDAGGSLTANSVSFVDGASRVISLASDNTTPATLFLNGDVSSSTLTSGTSTIQTTGVGSIRGTLNLGTATRIFTVANSTGDANTDMFVTTNITSGAGGGLQKEGAGTLELSGLLTYSGTTAINNGELKLSGVANLPANTDLTINGSASFGLSGVTQQVDDLNGNGTVNLTSGAQLQIGGLNNNGPVAGTFTGTITGNGSVVKNGTGTQIIGGASSYTGGTTVNNGTLQFVASNVLANSGDVTVNSPGVFNLNGFSDAIDDLAGSGSVTLGSGTLTVGGNNNDNSGSFSGNVSGGGSLVKSGSGTQEFTTAQGYTGGTTISTGTLKLSTAGALANTGDVSIGATGTLHLNGVSDTIDGLGGVAGSTVQITGGGTLTVGANSEASANFAGVIQGTGAGFTKTGSGTQTLSGNTANTYNGLTTVQGGTLALNKSLSNVTIMGNIDITGGELRLDASNQIADTSTVTMTSGTFNLNGFVETIAALSNSGGTLLTGGGSLTVGTMQWSGGTNTIGVGGSGTVNLPSLTISGGTNSVLAGGTLSANQISFSGAASPTLSLASAAGTPGTLVLTGDVSSNLTAGSSTIQSTGGGANRGTLNLGTATRTFTVNNSTGDANTDMLISANITSGAGGGLAKDGPGTLELSGLLTYSGTTAINNGELKLSGLANLPTNTDLTINSPASFGLSGITQLVDDLNGNGAINLTSSAQLHVGGLNNNGPTVGNFTGSITGNGSVVKNGTGTQILGGPNTYTGGTTINTGTLRLGGSNVLADTGDVSVGGSGTFDLSGNSDTIDDLSGTGSVLLGSGTLTVGGNNNDNSGAFGGSMSGGGSLVKTGSGTQEFTTAQSYSGGTTISSGTLKLSGAGALADTGDVSIGATGTLHLNGVSDTIDGLSGSVGSAVQLTGGVTLTVGANSEASANFAGVIQGSGAGFTKTGSGTQTLSGSAANTYNGLTAVQGGTLVLNKSGVPAVAGNISITSGTLRLDANNQIADTSTTTLSGGTFNLNGASETIGSLTNNSGTLLTGAGSLTAGTVEFKGGTNTVGAGGSVNATSLVVEGGTNTVQAGGAAGGTLTANSLTFSGSGSPVLDLQSAASGNDSAELVLNGNVQATGLGSMAQIVNSGGGAVRSTLNLGTAIRTFNVDNRDGGPGTDLYISADLTSGVNGGLAKDGPGTLELAGQLNYTGTTQLNNGELKLSGLASFPLNTDLTINSPASFGLSGITQQIDDLNGNGTINFSAGAKLVVGGLNNDGPSPGNLTGLIQGNGGLEKIGTGTQTLSSPNTYTGLTEIKAGVLDVTVNNALGSNAGGTTVDSGGTLKLSNNVNYSTSESLSLSGAGALVGTPGALLVDGNSATWTGDITVAADATIGAYNGGTLNLEGNVNKSGTTLTLQGNGAVANAININGGIGPNAVADSDLVVNNVTANVNSNIDYNGPTYVRNGGVLNVNSGNTATTSAITVGDSGTGTVNQQGNVNVSGGTGAGDLTVTSGTYNLQSSGTLDFQDSSGATGHRANNGNQLSALNVGSGGSFVFAGGTLQDVSTINPNGTFTLADGTLIVGQDATSPADFAAVTTINGSFLQLQGTVIKIDVFGPEITPHIFTDVEPIDLLTVNGLADLDGIIDMDFEAGPGGVVTLMTAQDFRFGPNFSSSAGFLRVIATGPGGPGFALQAVVPEPASIAVWSLVGVAGAAAAYRLRKRVARRRTAR